MASLTQVLPPVFFSQMAVFLVSTRLWFGFGVGHRLTHCALDTGTTEVTYYNRSFLLQ